MHFLLWLFNNNHNNHLLIILILVINPKINEHRISYLFIVMFQQLQPQQHDI